MWGFGKEGNWGWGGDRRLVGRVEKEKAGFEKEIKLKNVKKDEPLTPPSSQNRFSRCAFNSTGNLGCKRMCFDEGSCY